MFNFKETEDWIELHNTATSAIDAGGLFITDDARNRKKCRIPAVTASTLIQPGGYLLLWADEPPAQGPTHVGFRLSDSGEMVAIYQDLGSTIIELDRVDFPKITNNFSYARFLNGTGPFLITQEITPKAENGIVLASEGGEAQIRCYSNPVNDLLQIESGAAYHRVVIYDLRVG